MCYFRKTSYLDSCKLYKKKIFHNFRVELIPRATVNVYGNKLNVTFEREWLDFCLSVNHTQSNDFVNEQKVEVSIIR